MSRSGKGEVEFDDVADSPGGIAPRKGVMDFGDGESPKTEKSRDDNGPPSKQGSGSGGKTKLVRTKTLESH